MVVKRRSHLITDPNTPDFKTCFNERKDCFMRILTAAPLLIEDFGIHLFMRLKAKQETVWHDYIWNDT